MERISTRSSTPSLSLHHRNQLQLLLQDPLPSSPSPSPSPLPSPHFDYHHTHHRILPHSQQSSKVNSRAPSPVLNPSRINSANALHHHHHHHHHLIARSSAASTPLSSPNSGSSLGITLPLVPTPSTRPNTPHYFHPLHYQNNAGSIEELERLRRDHQLEIERLREESQSLKDEKAYLIAKNLRLERELKSINHVVHKPQQFQSHHSIQPLTQIDQPVLRRPSFNRSKSNPNVLDRMSNLSLSTHQIHHLHQLHRNASTNTTPASTAPPSPKSMKSRPTSTSNEELTDYITLNSIQRPHHSRDSSFSILPSTSSRSSSPSLKSILKKPSIPNLPHHQHGLARLAGIDQVGAHHSVSHHQRRTSDGFGI